jgi:hypothetical protein
MRTLEQTSKMELSYAQFAHTVYNFFCPFIAFFYVYLYFYRYGGLPEPMPSHIIQHVFSI